MPFALRAAGTFFIVRGAGATYDEAVCSGRFHLHVCSGNQIKGRKLRGSGHHSLLFLLLPFKEKQAEAGCLPLEGKLPGLLM